jgi:hypothetical protein
MKNILTFLLLLTCTLGFSQSTINPDTVCINTMGSTYEVSNIVGATFTWTVQAPGILVSGQTTNAIVVDWSLAPAGIIPNGITVTIAGQACPVTPVTLNVFIYQPVASITALGPFCAGDPCVNLVASPIGGTFTGSGVVGSTFCPNTAGTGSIPVTYSVIDNGCPVTTTVNVTVNPSFIVGPIQHD